MYACPVALADSTGTKALDINLPVDSGYNGELLLLPSDVEALGLKEVSRQEGQMMDKTPVLIADYEDVYITIKFMDNTTARAKVTPSVILQKIKNPSFWDCTKNPGAVVPLRKLNLSSTNDSFQVLGYYAMEKLHVKLDFENYCLVRKLTRI